MTTPHSSRLRLPGARWARHLSEPKLFAAGQEWDVIRVEADLGVRAVRLLEASGTPLGPVLHDQTNDQAYFLVPPGSARTWQHERTRALGHGSWVVLAPPGWEGGLLRWMSDPTDSPPHTPTADLARAFAAATAQSGTNTRPRAHPC
ncbi:hypothetical protein [Streptomyces lavenduligriseus]|uniref:DUF985 domain-containing protein n=1 Tax=Streptomyces lavenduligriseus TaxID=67315 RepID=A0ABT0NRE9_9ACTN|nr:hypothetical protein [Streptomyces lavenduligriseus]MCL3994037.1 hypothetical protein [Streptomyces lavenduligriseus]